MKLTFDLNKLLNFIREEICKAPGVETVSYIVNKEDYSRVTFQYVTKSSVNIRLYGEVFNGVQKIVVDNCIKLRDITDECWYFYTEQVEKNKRTLGAWKDKVGMPNNFNELTLEEFNNKDMTEKSTTLENGWDLILTQDYDKYNVFIDTKQKHPVEGIWLIVADASFNSLEDAEAEYNRLLNRYTSYLTAKLIAEEKGYVVKITEGTKYFGVKAITALVDNNKTTEVYIHYCSLKMHRCLFNFLEEAENQRYSNSWVLLYKVPSNTFTSEVKLIEKPEEKSIFI